MNTSIIKQSVTLSQACQMYGIDINRQGFSRCPFHSGDNTPSFKIYPGDRGFYCFGCGGGGDVIKFVQLLFNLNFIEAVKKLNTDFSLGLGEKPSYAEYRKSQRLQAERDKRRADAERHNEQYWALQAEYARLERNIELYKPVQFVEKLHPLYIEALDKIEYIGFQLDYFEFQEVR